MSDPSALPATMRAAVLYDVDDIRIEVRALPKLERGEVLVRTAASGVCSGDLMPWYVRKKAPFVFGHEPAGVVVAIGAGAAGFAPGDRVFAHHHAPCLACGSCARGEYVHCATWRASALDPGGMAEYFRVPVANLADTRRLPPEVPFVDGSLVEPLGCVVKSLRRAFPIALRRRLVPREGGVAASREALRDDLAPAVLAALAGLGGRILYVVGAGVMGLMHVALASALGATVVVSDFKRERLAAAKRLGAVDAFAPEVALERVRAATGGRLADVVVCCPGSASALAQAVEAVASDGTVVMFAPLEPDEPFVFDQSRAYFRDLRLVASYSCGPDDTAEALELIRRRIVTAEGLGFRAFAFPDVAAAYDAMREAAVVKAIVTFPMAVEQVAPFLSTCQSDLGA